MAFQKAHGLTIAQNGYIENMVCESVSSDPSVVEAGRLWFNETEKLFKFSTLNAGGGVVVKAIKDKEDYDTLVSNLAAQAADDSGAHIVGYDGQAGAQGDFSVTAGTVAAALDAIVSAIDQNTSEIDDITGGSGTSLSGLQSEVDAVETGVGLGTDGTYTQPSGSNYLDSSVSVMDGLDKLDTRAKTNADAISTEATNRANADDLKVDLAGDTMGGNLGFASTYRITGLAEPVDPADAATKNYVDAFSAGLDPKESARAATTGAITLEDLQTVDGVNLAAGDRVLVRAQGDAADNGIYVVVDGGAWTRATDFDGTPANEVSGGSFCFVEEGTAYQNMGFVVQFSGNVAVGTDDIVWVQFSGAGQITAGAGIAKTGNELYLKFGAGIIELPGDEIGIDLRAAGGLFLTEDGTTDSTATGAEIGIKLDGSTLQLGASGLRLSDSTNSTLSGLQTELDNSQSGAGLGTGGSYSADGASDYINSATSLFNADQLLDDQLKTVTDGLSSEVTARGNADSAIQGELDATQTGAGLSAAGAYIAPASNYLSGSTNIVGGMSQLDTAIKSNEDAIGAEVTARGTAVSNETTARSNADSALQGEIDAIETAMGTVIGTSGAYVAFSGTNYIDGNATVSADLTDLDTAIKAVSDALGEATGGSGTSLATLQTELDAVETALGGVLTETGTYGPFSGTNYIDGNAGLDEDLEDLDTQVKTNADNISSNDTDISNLQSELDATQVGAGLSAAGAYSVDALSNYLKAADFSGAGYTASVNSAVRLLDAALKAEETARGSANTTLQSEVDGIEGALGAMVSTSGAYVAHSGKNYINGNADVTADLIDLDAQLKTVTDGLATEVSDRATAVTNAIDTLETAIDDLVYTFTSSGAATQHTINHALGDEMIDVTVWVKDTDLKYRNDLVGITISDSNNVVVDLTESREIKAVVRSTAALA